MLDQFHLRCLRKIAHIKYQDQIPNTAVLERCQISGIEIYLLAAQFHWTGHVIRMDDHWIKKTGLQTADSRFAVPWWTIQTLQRHTKGHPEVVAYHLPNLSRVPRTDQHGAPLVVKLCWCLNTTV